MKQTDEWWIDLPGKSWEGMSELGDCGDRELPIVAAAWLDVGLGELLSKRLRDLPGESKEFLGLDDDGRAPAGSFGARIQLALLLGLIPQPMARMLRNLKKIRNLMAHRLTGDLENEKVMGPLVGIIDAFAEYMKESVGMNWAGQASAMRALLPDRPDIRRDTIRMCQAMCIHHIHIVAGAMSRIDEVETPAEARWTGRKSTPPADAE